MSDQNRLNRTTGEGDEGTNQANHFIRGEIRWPEMRVRKFELWEIMCGKTKSFIKRQSGQKNSEKSWFYTDYAGNT